MIALEVNEPYIHRDSGFHPKSDSYPEISGKFIVSGNGACLDCDCEEFEQSTNLGYCVCGHHGRRHH